MEEPLIFIEGLETFGGWRLDSTQGCCERSQSDFRVTLGSPLTHRAAGLWGRWKDTALGMAGMGSRWWSELATGHKWL